MTRSGAPQQLAGTGSLPGGLLLNNRYTIIAKLAQGGMSAVYKVLDNQQPGQQWALKEMSLENLDPDEIATAIEDFHREADLLGTLAHPNLVKVLDRFSSAGKEYLVMEYIQGETLDEKADARLLSEAEVFEIAFQLCDVLEYLHELKPPIIYRDLKPGNIMNETRTGLLKLIDFGIVRFYKPGQRKDTKLLGTPGFAPPEQYGKEQTDARSDIFALGVTLLVLLTGYDVTQNPWSYPPARKLNPQVTQRLEKVIQKTVELKVVDRYQSVQQLRNALKTCKGAKKILATLPSSKLKAHAYQVVQPAAIAQPAQSASQGTAHPGSTGGTLAGGIKPFGQQSAAPQRATPPRITPQPIIPQPIASPSATPVLNVTPLSLRLRGRLGRKVVAQITVTSSTSQTVQGQVTTSAQWLAVDPNSFDGVQTVLDITAQASPVSLPNLDSRPPAVLARAWQWAVKQGADPKPWQNPQTWQRTLAIGVPALLGGGLAHLLVWLVYWHAGQWASGVASLDETVEVRAGQALVTVPVHVDVAPALHRSTASWGAAIIAVIGEIAILVFFLSRLA